MSKMFNSVQKKKQKNFQISYYIFDLENISGQCN